MNFNIPHFEAVDWTKRFFINSMKSNVFSSLLALVNYTYDIPIHLSAA